MKGADLSATNRPRAKATRGDMQGKKAAAANIAASNGSVGKMAATHSPRGVVRPADLPTSDIAAVDRGVPQEAAA